jgi:ABC-type transporter Mla subunit MlaD
MQNEIQTIVELGKQASALAISASVESAHLREAQERLGGIAAGISVLAEEAAAVAADFHDKLVVAESDLRPPVRMIALMTGVLKRIKELSETVEDTLRFQRAATQGLVVSVGEAVGGGTRITNQIVALAQAIQTAVPRLRNKRKVEDELTHLTSELHDFVAHFRNRGGNMGAAVPEVATGRPLGRPPSVN